MSLTQTQLTTLKADIAADSVLSLVPETADGSATVAAAYNLNANPPFTVWKTNVSITEVGNNIVATDLAGLSTLNSTRLQTVVMLSQDGINASLSDRRAFFDDIFSGAGGAATRAKLLILWKRLATRAEKLYAIPQSPGSDASPSTLTFEGEIMMQDVQDAWAIA